MRTSAATNAATSPAQAPCSSAPGYAVNNDIPVAGLEPWKREAFHAIAQLAGLPPNWDGQGSRAPCMDVKDVAIELIRTVPSGLVSATPHIVPVSGGGFHFEFSSGNRELEVSIERDGKAEALRVENGMPLEDDESFDLRALFGWLAGA